MNTIPSVKSRDRNADLNALARVVVKERLSFNEEKLNGHVAEGGDLLTHFVTAALGAEYHVQWGTLSDAEAPDVCTLAKEWSDYCCELFNDVEAHVLSRLG